MVSLIFLFDVHIFRRPVTRGVRGVRPNPTFREPHSKITNPPPPDLNISNSISDIVFIVGPLRSTVSTPTHHTLIQNLLFGVSWKRFPNLPPSTLYLILQLPWYVKSHDLPKNRRPIVAGESLQYRHYFAHHDVPCNIFGFIFS